MTDKEAAFCLGCGVRHGEDEPCVCTPLDPYRSIPQGPRLGACPSCTQALVDETYADTALEECLACGGIFLDAHMLDRLVEAKDQRLSLAISLPVRDRVRDMRVRYLPCPRCVTPMNRKIFGRSSGIVVDVCKEHGVWFDAGELAAVLAFIEGGGLERARLREAQEAAERARAEKTRRAVEAASTIGHSLSTPAYTRSDLAAQVVEALVEWWK
ncbi:MAG: TFIIB-type zinc ribbon-containing protein [Polyangiales bacterium]